jgi:hypothetical protein
MKTRSKQNDANSLSLDSPRIRFNWGYHDGADEFARGCRRDVRVGGGIVKAYVDGYAAGVADARGGTYAGDSETAWTEYTR